MKTFLQLDGSKSNSNKKTYATAMLHASLSSYYAENSGAIVSNTAKFPAPQPKANIYIFQRKKKKS